MTVEADLLTAIKTVTPKVFPDFAPAGTARPYVTYQQIGGVALTFLGRELPSKQNSHIQVNVWADTRAQAKALILSIEAALTTATAFQAHPLAASVSDFDADMLVYGSRQDFSIWSDR